MFHLDGKRNPKIDPSLASLYHSHIHAHQARVFGVVVILVNCPYNATNLHHVRTRHCTELLPCEAKLLAWRVPLLNSFDPVRLARIWRLCLSRPYISTALSLSHDSTSSLRTRPSRPLTLSLLVRFASSWSLQVSRRTSTMKGFKVVFLPIR